MTCLSTDDKVINDGEGGAYDNNDKLRLTGQNDSGR